MEESAGGPTVYYGDRPSLVLRTARGAPKNRLRYMKKRSASPSLGHVGSRGVLSVLAVTLLQVLSATVQAVPELVDKNLAVRPVVTGLITPTSMAFIGANDFLVLEKTTGQVKRIKDGVVHSVVLDLAVNFGSERGLLGLALYPQFPANPGVYLDWTESATGVDTNGLSATALLGNRVDRFVWDGAVLALDQNLIRIRARQNDAGQPERGNHDGGVLRFGPDGKLYILIGDLGRRGQMQNLPDGPGPRGI